MNNSDKVMAALTKYREETKTPSHNLVSKDKIIVWLWDKNNDKKS